MTYLEALQICETLFQMNGGSLKGAGEARDWTKQ
ncbi:MAG: hypothetical protein ACJARR_000262 [Pseudophaeobacter arcticus]|jgi:hypothetical protein